MPNEVFKSNSSINQPIEWLKQVRSFCSKHNISRNKLIYKAVLAFMDNSKELTRLKNAS